MTDQNSEEPLGYFEAVIDHYFDHDLYIGMERTKQRLVWLAFEYAAGMMSERVFNFEIMRTAGVNGFPSDHAAIIAQHVLNVLRRMLSLGEAETQSGDDNPETGQ